MVVVEAVLLSIMMAGNNIIEICIAFISVLVLSGAFIFYYRKNEIFICIPLIVILYMLSIVGIFVFSVHEQALWMLLLFHAYTDITDRTVFYRWTWVAILSEAAAVMVIKPYYESPWYLPFGVALIVLILGRFGAFAGGDTEVFILIILYAYNSGKDVIGYMMGLLFLSCMVFILYMLISNAVNIIFMKKHWRNKGAFLPAVTAAYFIMTFL